MNRKLIFLDIDGTLTTPGSNTPPESAMKAVRLAREKGHKVFLCVITVLPLQPYERGFNVRHGWDER